CLLCKMEVQPAKTEDRAKSRLQQKTELRADCNKDDVWTPGWNPRAAVRPHFGFSWGLQEELSPLSRDLVNEVSAIQTSQGLHLLDAALMSICRL
ncbi:mCG146216, partial [Mus musculus]